MSQSTISRELALGIGLAARALPVTGPKQLMIALTDTLGLPLTVAKLRALSLPQYHKLALKSLGQRYKKQDLQRSLEHLKSVKVIDNQPIEPYISGEIPNSIRLAVASVDGQYVDGQFSLCEQFYIYQLSAEQQRLIAIRDVNIPANLKSEEKQLYRAELINDCQVLYSLSIGGKAAAKVVKEGVHPMKIDGEVEILDIIKQLQQVLNSSPPPWLAKAMVMKSESITLKVEEEVL